MIYAGEFYDAKVKRKTDIGYMLDILDEEVFLHNKETLHELNEEETVRCFLYYDSKKRLAATMHEALITTTKAGWVKVKDVVNELGIFVEIGIQKDMLISKEFLPYDTTKWALKDEELFCILKEKNSRLNAKIVSNKEIKEYQKGNIEYVRNDLVEAYVTRIMEDGYGFYTKELVYVFVHITQTREKLHLGQFKELKILNKSFNGYTATLLATKENMIDDDCLLIKNYLINNNNFFPFDSDSSSEDILRTFNLSKKAFKRALGSLYKQHLIEFKDNGTYWKGK